MSARTSIDARASHLFSYQLATADDTRRGKPRLQRSVKRVDQRKRSRIDQQAVLHLVHRVAKADFRFGIGISKRAARARMSERFRIRAERRARLRHHEAE